jgi:hypothetical protein
MHRSCRKDAAVAETVVDTAFTALSSPIVREQKNAGMQVFDAMYLGHNRVMDVVSQSVILKAIRQNGVVRQGMETTRITKKQRRYSIESATLVQEDYGVAVAEHPVAIMVTKRTLRIVDCMSGETVEKLPIRNIELAEEIPGGRSTVGMIHVDKVLNNTQCHLFYTGRGVGQALTKAIRSMVAAGEEEKKRMSVSTGGPFTPLPGAVRDPSPPELFALQIHRADIIPKHGARQTECCTRGCHWIPRIPLESSTALTVATINYVQTLKACARGRRVW